jgi:hypothetical protein
LVCLLCRYLGRYARYQVHACLKRHEYDQIIYDTYIVAQQTVYILTEEVFMKGRDVVTYRCSNLTQLC